MGKEFCRLRGGRQNSLLPRNHVPWANFFLLSQHGCVQIEWTSATSRLQISSMRNARSTNENRKKFAQGTQLCVGKEFCRFPGVGQNSLLPRNYILWANFFLLSQHGCVQIEWTSVTSRLQISSMRNARSTNENRKKFAQRTQFCVGKEFCRLRGGRQNSLLPRNHVPWANFFLLSQHGCVQIEWTSVTSRLQISSMRNARSTNASGRLLYVISSTSWPLMAD